MKRSIADSALAEPFGAGGDAQARYPQSGDFIANVSARQIEGKQCVMNNERTNCLRAPLCFGERGSRMLSPSQENAVTFYK